MTKFLLSADNPKGWKLEDLLLQLQNDIVTKMARISADQRPEARIVFQNNIDIISMISECHRKAVESQKILESLGPSPGSTGAPRIGTDD
ncbi:MAG: histidine kinase [Alphaproteobacteria bacterium]|jgi:hypothetical protein|nr:histidine kinase [Alphaproteobacteria bacterium]MBT4020362.1 histidine kinase [Alphaproteobacteria bacterium]MBT5161438.1 histidine kinase [Alphaproteobacteria bacterium]MBT7747881.1 histidine kinase [Alphaproteobacteria bacterium]